MDILLTHGYFLREDAVESKIMKPYPPLGILYISSYLKSKGFTPEVFDSTFKSKEELYQRIEKGRPGVVGIYVNLMTKLSALEIIRYCKSRQCTVIVGGPEVPHHAENFLNHGADIAVLGEAEQTLEELLPCLRRGSQELHAVAGIVFRDGTGELVRTAIRPLVPNLDILPDPDRNAIDMQMYVDVWRSHHGRGSISLICARGCPFTCTWCSRSVFGETHRRRSVKRVVDEIEHVQEAYRPDQLWFCDDVFTINQRWFYEFYDEMKKRDIRIPFECISRADRLTEDILKKMADLGSFRIWYGSESGSQRILDAMDRRVTVERITSVTRLAQKYGIEAGLFVMLGYPGEEISDIDATIEHLKETNPDTYLTTVAYPIKGTPMYDEVSNRLISNTAWDETTDRRLNFSGRHSDRFYWFATRHLVNEVLHHKFTINGAASYTTRTITFLKARAARLGMKWTQSHRT